MKETNAKGQPRRRVVPLWRSRPALALWALLSVASFLGGGIWLLSNGVAARVSERARGKIIAVSREMGFTVREILVMGRSQTTRLDLLDAIHIDRGDPILTFDLNAARQRVESLPWVHSATIERMLPDIVFVTVAERKPFALWQNKGQFALIDSEGKVIINEGVDRFSDLFQVVGDDAPAHAAKLLEMLATQPELLTEAKAAVRVGGRRWNILMNNGINVHLPEDNAENAWARLAEYERANQVLDRDIKVLDLRIPDRLIVRKTPRLETPEIVGGRET